MLLMMVVQFWLVAIANFSKPNSDCKNSQVPRSSNVFGPMSSLAVTLLQREQNKECEGFWHSAVRLVSQSSFVAEARVP